MLKFNINNKRFFRLKMFKICLYQEKILCSGADVHDRGVNVWGRC